MTRPRLTTPGGRGGALLLGLGVVKGLLDKNGQNGVFFKLLQNDGAIADHWCAANGKCPVSRNKNFRLKGHGFNSRRG